MPQRKLTDKGIEKLTAPPSGRVEIWDAGFGEGAFGLRVTEKGTKTFQLMYRFDGKLRRKTIGQYPTIGLGEAHDAARSIIRKAKAGEDPELAEAAAAGERARSRANTFGAVAKLFITQYAKKRNKGWEQVERYFDRDLAEWHDRPMASITRRDVLAAIAAKANSGAPLAANRLLAHTRKLFGWAVEQDIIGASPAVGVKPVGKETERERVVTDDEIRGLWAAWEAMKWPFGPMLRLLLVTGQRRDEVAGMRWVDIDEQNNVWTIPGELTKAGRSHEVPLSPLALEILATVPRTKSGYVFASRSSGDRYASGFSRAKAHTIELSRVADWRIHDLRRTAGTGMASAGIAVSTISRVLNHAEGGVTKIYNRYSYGQEKRHALDTWARKLEGIIRTPVANVVEMRMPA